MSATMLILHVITGLETGGAETQLKQLVLGSDSSRFRHVVVSLVEGGPLAGELGESGVEVHSLRMRRGVPSLAGTVRLITLLRRLRPDVVHGWLYHGCLMGLVGARLARVPYVIWGMRSANASLQSYSFLTRLVVRLDSMLSGLPSRIAVNSEAGRIVHEQLGFNTARMRVIPNGVDVEVYCPDQIAGGLVREELGLSPDSLLVGMFARCNPMKDHQTFFRAASLVHAQNPDVHFLLAGKGVDSDNQQLSKLIRENKVHDVVHLLGVRRDMPRLIAAVDVVCLPSWSESFPNILVEALSCGVPCAATNVGDIERIVGNAGRIVPPRSPEALAGGLVELLGLDPVERQKLGCQGRHRICAEFPSRESIRLYEAMYENLPSRSDSRVARPVAGHT